MIPESSIAEIAARVPPAVGTFLLTSRQDAAAIIAQQRRCRTNTVQICDRLEERAYHRLRQELPGIGLVQVIHVTGPEAVEEALSLADEVDGLLLDSGNRALKVKELGGTGRTHDWKLSRQIRDEVKVPVFLAGGLNAGNVSEAIDAVQPFGLDLCGGVRTNGQLGETKLAGFMRAVAAGSQDP